MKINFIISKLYNHFHFVENMSEWSEYTRKGANRDWIAATGPLTEVETKVLARVGKFFSLYDYGKTVGGYKNIFEFFAVAETLEDYRAELASLIGERDARVIPEAMGVFHNRFEKIWTVQIANFDSKYPMIVNNIHEEDIKNDIAKIFGIDKFPEEINIYLVISTSKYASGGANIGEGRITLECSTAVDDNDIMSIFWHEITHLVVSNYVREVHEIVQSTASREFVNETITHSLFGIFGVLTSRYFQLPNQIETIQMIDNYVNSGKAPESGKQFMDRLPFGLGPYYLAQFIEAKLNAEETITEQQMAKVLIDIHKKA